ncbi:hypothetical protein ACFYOV_15120 [Streptomyces sp. NPDC005931]|uniref:hypothetical protein n=1 Tax=Streptomyces sp. NPDC005931 TaxID=3364737 RepID=UPI0036D04385
MKLRTALIGTGAPLALVALLGTTASAATLYTERATAAGSSPTIDAHCLTVPGYENPRAIAGTACFKHYGDRFWIKDNLADGHHIEMRGQVNTTGDNFRCYELSGSSAGWQICDSFSDNIPENAVLAWNIGLWEGNDLLRVGSERWSPTS